MAEMKKATFYSTLSWQDQLSNQGYSYLPNQTEAQLDEMLNVLGQVIQETDVVADAQSSNLVTSNQALDFHTDNHLARYIVWHCQQPAPKGGMSLLCDAELVYAQLNEEEQNLLSKIHVFEHKVFPENRNSNPIVREIDGQRKFYYSFWLAREKYREMPVFKHWCNVIKATPAIKIHLKQHDVLVIDNHRMFHGRTMIEGNRFLKRYWLSINAG